MRPYGPFDFCRIVEDSFERLLVCKCRENLRFMQPDQVGKKELSSKFHHCYALVLQHFRCTIISLFLQNSIILSPFHLLRSKTRIYQKLEGVTQSARKGIMPVSVCLCLCLCMCLSEATGPATSASRDCAKGPRRSPDGFVHYYLRVRVPWHEYLSTSTLG